MKNDHSVISQTKMLVMIQKSRYYQKIDNSSINIKIFISMMTVGAFLFMLLLFMNHGSIWGNFLVKDDKDTFMDFFHSVSRVYGGNPYEHFVNYPAFPFLIYKVIFRLLPLNIDLANGFAIRGTSAGMLMCVFFLAVQIIGLFYILRKEFKNLNFKNSIIIFIILCGPFVFAIERANIIIVSMIGSLLFALYYDSDSKWLRVLAIVSLSIASAIKLYPAILLLLYLKDKDVLSFFKGIGLHCLFFFIPFLFFGGIESIGVMLKALLFTTTEYQNLGFGNSFSLITACNIFESITSIDIYKIAIFAFVLSFFINIVRSKCKIDSLIVLTCSIILIPSISYTYSLIFIIIPLVFVLKHTQNLWYYIVPITLILIPYGFPYAEMFSIDCHFPLTYGHIIQLGSLIVLYLIVTVRINFVVKFSCLKESSNDKSQITRVSDECVKKDKTILRMFFLFSLVNLVLFSLKNYSGLDYFALADYLGTYQVTTESFAFKCLFICLVAVLNYFVYKLFYKDDLKINQLSFILLFLSNSFLCIYWKPDFSFFPFYLILLFYYYIEKRENLGVIFLIIAAVINPINMIFGLIIKNGKLALKSFSIVCVTIIVLNFINKNIYLNLSLFNVEQNGIYGMFVALFNLFGIPLTSISTKLLCIVSVLMCVPLILSVIKSKDRYLKTIACCLIVIVFPNTISFNRYLYLLPIIYLSLHMQREYRFLLYASIIMVFPIPLPINMNIVNGVILLTMLAFVIIKILCLKLTIRRGRVINILSNKVQDINLPLVLSLVFITIYALTQFNKTFPISEGWYSEYARLVNSGLSPYTDFEFLFPPTYLYIVTFITYLFGYDFIVLRIFGVLLFVLIGFIAFKIFEKLTNRTSASIASVTTVMYMQSEVAQVFYDYIRVFDFINYLALFSLVCLVMDFYKNKRISMKCLIFLGITLGISITIRQSSGLINSAYVFVVLSIIIFQHKQRINNLLIYILTLMIPIVIIMLSLYSNGSLSSFISSTTSSAIAAKGGMLNILFQWIPGSIQVMITNIPYILFTCGALLMLFMNYRKKGNGENNSTSNILSILAVFCLLMYITYKSMKLSNIFLSIYIITPHMIFCIVFLIFCFAIFHYFRGYLNERNNLHIWVLLIISGYIISTGYGAGTSGGLSEGQTALGLGLITSLVIYYARYISSSIFINIATITFLSLSISAGARKYTTTYYWWGLTEPNIWEAKFHLDVPHMNGILVSENTKIVIEGVYQDIIQNSNRTDGIFSFPLIPFTYVISEREPITESIVQWFDVVSVETMNRDLDAIKVNKPKVIVYSNIPEAAIDAHETLFLNSISSPQRDFIKLIESYECDGTYRLLNIYNLNEEHFIKTYVLNSKLNNIDSSFCE